jgi:DNA-directed RNA polymerase specialized sigma24 family protein
MKKRIKQFGGDNRVFLEDHEINNIADKSMERLGDDAMEAVDIIKDGFGTLSDIQRRVISMLCTIKDDTDEYYTIKDIAESLGMQIGTVRTHYKRAKNKLKKLVLQNADASIYIESMLGRMKNDKAETDDDTDGAE